MPTVPAPRHSRPALVLLALGAGLAPAARADSPPAASPATAGSVASRPATTMPAYGPWFSSRIGGGGYLLDARIHPKHPRIWHAHSDVAGVFRSEDAGASWRMIHGGLPPAPGNYCVRSFDIAPDNADELVIAAGSMWYAPEGLYRSTDAGRTWQPVLRATIYGNEDHRWAGPTLLRDRQNPARLWAATASGLFASTDRGATWQEVNDSRLRGLFPTALVQDPRRPDRLWLCARPFTPWEKPELRGGFFRSDDRGRTWEKIADQAPNEIHPHPKHPDLVLGLFEDIEFRVSRDGGDTWKTYHEGLPPTPADNPYMAAHRFHAVTATPDGWTAMNVEGTLYRRALRDDTWTPVPRLGLEQGDWYARETPGKWSHFGRAASSIHVSPHDPKHWLFTDWYALYESRDAGSSWTIRVNGIETTVMHVIRQDPSDPGRVHAGMGDIGYVQSRDGGVRFTQSKSYLTSVKQIDLADSHPARVYALGTNTGKWYGEKLFVSLNHGDTFAESPLLGVPRDPERRFNSLAVDPRDPLRLFLAVSGPAGTAGGGGVYVSEDGGRSFRLDFAGVPDGADFFEPNIWGIGAELAIAPDGTAYAHSLRQREVWRRKSDESAWTKLKFPPAKPFAVAASPHTPDLVFVASNGQGLWRSADAGDTWARVIPGDAKAIVPDRVRAGRWVAGTGEGVHLSEDDGRTWRVLGPELPGRHRPTVAFAGDRVIAGTLGNGLFWAPLTPAAAAPVAARPIVESNAQLFPPMKPALAATLAAATALNAHASLPNGDMSEGGAQPAGWSIWTGAGQLELTRDTTTYFSAPAALSLRAPDGETYGSAYTSLPLDVRQGTLGGFFRVEGSPTEAKVAVQVMDSAGRQLTWTNLVDGGASGEWREFSESYTLPDGAASASIVAVLRGPGRVLLDDLRLDVVTRTDAASAGASAAGGADQPRLSPAAAGWRTWIGKGAMILARGPGAKGEANTALVATSADATTEGTAYFTLPIAPGAHSVELRGATRIEGDLEGAQLVVQSFDAKGGQVGWTVLAETGPDWSGFTHTAHVPPAAASVNLVLVVKGRGTFSLDGLSWR